MSLLNYVPYVLSYPTCLVPHMLSCPTCLVSCVLLCLTCFTCLVSNVLLYPSCLASYELLCPTCFVPCGLLYLTCFMLYVILCFTCLLLQVFCALNGLVPPRFMSLFFLGTLLSLTLHTLCPNITFRALEFQCISLLIFCSFANCLFFSAHLLKLKQISFTSNTLKWRSVFINSMIYLNYLKPNMKIYTYETANYFGTGKSKFRIGEITGNLSTSFGI